MTKNIVVIGGGTGTYTLLTGLKKFDVNLTAIVSMFDSGGSTGRLRDEFGELPKGDVRRCLIALSHDENRILRRLFEYRFSKGEGLNGHSFGNLFLTALREITGSEESGIKHASKLLGINGKVLPVTFNNCHLCAELENGSIVKGETNIDIPKHDGNLSIKRVFLDGDAILNPAIENALLSADLIVIGPGDLYTSILPNFLVDGFGSLVNKSNAQKIYICNLMTKHGETNNYSASDFLKQILEYTHVNKMICNVQNASEQLLKKYAEENSYQVVIDYDKIPANVLVVEEELLKAPELIRHDSDKIAKLLLEQISKIPSKMPSDNKIQENYIK